MVKEFSVESLKWVDPVESHWNKIKIPLEKIQKIRKSTDSHVPQTEYNEYVPKLLNYNFVNSIRFYISPIHFRSQYWGKLRWLKYKWVWKFVWIHLWDSQFRTFWKSQLRNHNWFNRRQWEFIQLTCQMLYQMCEKLGGAFVITHFTFGKRSSFGVHEKWKAKWNWQQFPDWLTMSQMWRFWRILLTKFQSSWWNDKE